MSREQPLQSPSRPTVYPTAIDWWIALLLLLAPAIQLIVALAAIARGQEQAGYTLIAVAAFALLVTMVFTYPCRYTIDHDGLTIRCGLFRFYFRHPDIAKVNKTASLRSGPALSLKRVEVITDRGRRIIISPRDRDAFIADLRSMMSGDYS